MRETLRIMGVTVIVAGAVVACAIGNAPMAVVCVAGGLALWAIGGRAR